MKHDYVIERIDEMLAHPTRWGGPEAFELQVLLLLELRFYPESRRELVDRYVGFLKTRFPELGVRSLSSIETDHGKLAEVLTAFRNELRADNLR